MIAAGSFIQLLGSHLIAHLGPQQFLGRPVMQITIHLLQTHLVAHLPLVHKQGVLFLVVHLPVCLAPKLPHQFLVPRQPLLLGVQRLLLELHQAQPLVLHRLRLVVSTNINFFYPNSVLNMTLIWFFMSMLVTLSLSEVLCVNFLVWLVNISNHIWCVCNLFLITQEIVGGFFMALCSRNCCSIFSNGGFCWAHNFGRDQVQARSLWFCKID